MKFIKILVVILSLFMLSGCWDRIELEEQAFVVVLGLDKGPKPGLINVTYQIANPQVGSSTLSVAPNEPASEIVSVSVPSVVSGKDTANTIAPREINLSHLETIIVGSELAKTKNFDRILSSSIREPELRRETNIIVTKESALEFIKNNKPIMETRPHKYYEFMMRRWKETGLVPYATINRYFERRETTNTILLAIYATTQRDAPKLKGEEDGYYAGQVPEKNGDPAQVIGSAVLNKGRMVDVLTGDQTRLSLLLRKKAFATSWGSTFIDPLSKNYRISVRVIKHYQTKVKFNVKQAVPKVYITVPLEIELTSIPSEVDYINNKKNQEILRTSLEKDLEKSAMKMVKRSQTKYQDDPFLWSIYVKRAFPTEAAYRNYHWKEKFPRAEVHIDFDIEITDFGKQLKPPK